jgi:SAM-dependent methyltransferase
MTSDIHHTAADGFARSADAYVRGRPDYPPEITGWLRDSIRLRPGMTAADLGAGTGKFTPYLLETGASVIAVEPVDQMREKISALPVEVIEGSAVSIPLPSESVDAIVCAQSFHWFANAAALAEIHRLLKPGGRLGLVWNAKDDRVEWVAKFDQILERYQGDTPRYRSGNWRKAFPTMGFGPLHEARFAHGHTGPAREVILDRIRSISFMAKLPPEEWNVVEQELEAMIMEEFGNADTIIVPYETFAYWTEKTG